MAKKATTPFAAIVDEAIALLEDAIADLKKIRAGRPFEPRYRVIAESIYGASDKLHSISPYRKYEVDADDSPAIAQKKPLALEHKPNLF